VTVEGAFTPGTAAGSATVSSAGSATASDSAQVTIK
jgi:hypothetical protein